MLQGLVSIRHSAEVWESVARVLRLIEMVLDVRARRVQQGAHDHLRRPRLFDTVGLAAVC